MKSLKHVFGLCLSQKKGYNDSSYAGMTKQGMTASSDEGDEVERSLQLLDRVLEEFDDLENANLGGAVPRTASSEDDGYMSLNGRRKPPVIDTPPPSAHEAQRIIANLLPKVSPSNSSKRGSRRGKLHTSLTLGHEERYSTDEESRVPATTQTTVPKTRHQRPYGWQNGRVPPRTVASTTAAARHREVRRDVSPIPDLPAPPEVDSVPLTQTDLHPVAELSDANFSDDSLEGVPPPPPPRGSIAWEVPLDDEHALYTPGSTKVIGRRRRRSTDRSSTGSICRLREQEEWPDPPTGTEDGSISPLSDSSHLDSSIASKQDDGLPPELSGTDMSSGGTYVVRKPRQRKQLPLPEEEVLNGEKRTSTTFDNIKSLLREGLIEGLDEAPPDFPPPTPPSMVRVVSLPAFPSDKEPSPSEEKKKEDKFKDLGTTVEEDEDSQSSTKCDIGIQVTPEASKEPVNSESTDSESERKRERSVVILNGTDTSSNEALMRELKRTYDTESINNNIELNTKLETAQVEELEDPWLTAAEISQVQVIPVVSGSPEKPPKEFKVKVEVLQHEFGPLPPSPVEEVDEYSDVLRSSPKQNSRSKPDRKESFYRCSEPAGSDPVGSRFQNRAETSVQHGTSSLKTRSMDAGFSRNHRSHQSATSRSKDGVGERRTLPCELQGPRRRTYQKRGEPHMQVSCSLPETPIFARGCDIPRTPHRKAPDVPSTAPRASSQHQSNTSTYRSTGMSLGEAMAGAELLRLAGGPGRGWYPRHGHPRPASVEHLDRIPHPWTPHDHRKPQTLPPNLTPKFFHKSPRDALRRVTSLLIRKGNSKDKKEVLSPTAGIAEGSDTNRQKKGFFRNWWKKSRHYSLDQQANGQPEQ